MPSPPPFRPAIGATIVVNAGVWTSATRGTASVTVTLDARLLLDAVNDAARKPGRTVQYGIGNPRLQVTLT